MHERGFQRVMGHGSQTDPHPLSREQLQMRSEYLYPGIVSTSLEWCIRMWAAGRQHPTLFYLVIVCTYMTAHSLEIREYVSLSRLHF